MVRNHSFFPRFNHFQQETFLRYLDDFNVVDDEQELFRQLENYHDVLPWNVAYDLELPPGATYAAAVALLRSAWQLV
jgi:hypothetical protein